MARYLVTVYITVIVLALFVAAGIHIVNARMYVLDMSDTVTVNQVIR